MDAAAELGRNPVSKHQIQLSMEMSRLTRDGTAEPVSRDQILRHARGRGNIIFPVQLTTSRIGNLTRLIHTLLYVMTIHTYIHTLCSLLLTGICEVIVRAISIFICLSNALQRLLAIVRTSSYDNIALLYLTNCFVGFIKFSI